MTWTSSTGLRLRDHVPRRLRRRWVRRGWCPDRDLYALFSEGVRAHPGRAAVVDPGGSVDYATLDADVRRVAAALSESGLGPGDVIGIQVPDGRQAVAAELAVAAIGAVSLPYVAGRGWRNSVSLLGRARARAAVVAARAGGIPLAANLAAVRDRLPHLRTVLVFGEAPAGCRSLDPWLAAAAPRPGWQPAPVDPEAPARILVSSGSEAEPKMVAYSHNAFAGGRASYVAALHGGCGPMRNLILVPLASSYGSLGIPVTVACHHGTLLVLHRFDPAAALRTIVEQRPTHVFGVPTMLRRIAHAPRLPDEDTSSLRAIVSSGAALRVPAVEACRRRFACPIINVYGSSDGVNCHTTGTDGLAEEGWVGRPDPAVAEIVVVDGDGRRVPAGQAGEIWARGPMTPLCYVAAPELDARYRAPGGWVRTGDCGLLDGDGRLRVVGRMRQVVVRGGYNISPAEIEQELARHPDVAEAACLGLPDAELGERLCACLVQHPGSGPLTLSEVNTFLEDERGVERRKLPEELLVLPELPLGATGKVCRPTLRRLVDGAEGPSAGDAAPARSKSGRTRP